MSRGSSLSNLALFGAVALATLGAAAGSYAPPTNDALAVELFKLARDKRSHFVDSATKTTWGRGQIFVDAPMKHVRSAITDYGNWSTFIPRFKKSKVLTSNAKGTEVYLQIPILKGAVTLWGVVRFSAPVVEGKGEKIVGKFVSGNVEDLQATWHYRPVDETHTVVTLELYVQPKMIVPESVMIGQREWAAGEGVLGVRERAQEITRTLAAKKP
jgi:ribosome-associated toxin RatA of RatAB toxin-antitoxin module